MSLVNDRREGPRWSRRRTQTSRIRPGKLDSPTARAKPIAVACSYVTSKAEVSATAVAALRLWL